MTDIYLTLNGSEKATKVETAWIVEDADGDYEMHVKVGDETRMLLFKSARV